MQARSGGRPFISDWPRSAFALRVEHGRAKDRYIPARSMDLVQVDMVGLQANIVICALNLEMGDEIPIIGVGSVTSG